jgi:hypothetical protein
MTTDRQIHPSELAQLLRTRTTTKGVAVGLLAVALLLLAGGGRALTPESKLWLFGGAFGCGLMCRIVNRVAADHDELFSDASDISLTNWQNRLFKLTRNTDLVVAEVFQPEVTPPPLPMFKWTELSDEDEHPVIAVVAPMGGGKSRLVKYLAKYAMFDTQPQIVALDIYARSQDWPDAVTDHESMLRLMTADLEDLQIRIPQYRNGITDFAPRVRVLEEAVDSLPSISRMSKAAAAIVTDWLTKHVSVARKVKYRLMLVSVKLGGTDIGIGAESRDDATIIFPGQKGIAKAFSDIRYLKLGTQQQSKLRDQLRTTLDGLDRPALVYHSGVWYPASIPELSAAGDPIGMAPMLMASAAPTIDFDLMDSIAALCDRLDGKRENCTPGMVRKYCRDMKDMTDSEIMAYFQRLHDEGRATLDRTGKTPKLVPNAHFVAAVAATAQAL